MRPVFWLTAIEDGPPESAHCRSVYASWPGTVMGAGSPNVSPPSTEVATHMLWLPKPLARLWYIRYTRFLPVVASFGPTANHWRSWSTSVFDPFAEVHVLPSSSV